MVGLDTTLLGPLPIIAAFCERLRLAGLLNSFVRHDDTRLKLGPPTAIGVVVVNLAIGRALVYALGEWRRRMIRYFSGLTPKDIGAQ